MRKALLFVVHNCLVHPLLPLASLLEALGGRKISRRIYGWHDRTAPEEDV